MSYSLTLFDTGTNRPTVSAAHAWLDAQEQALVAGNARRAAPPWLEQLRSALSTRHPDLRVEPVSSVEWALAQLAEPDDGVEIRFYSDHVSISVPYWHAGARAEHVLERVGDYVRTVCDVTGYTVYDQQLDAIVRLPGDLPRMIERYSGSTRKLRRWVDDHQQREQQ